MNKTYKIQLPRNKEAQNIKTSIKDGTIEVEVELNEKWEPKDGDICYLKANNTHVFVFKSFRYNKTGASCYVSLSGNYLVYDAFITNLGDIRPATDEEKKKLFDALAKQNKRWNAEKKVLEDVRWRAKKGEIYYALTLSCDVDTVIETGTLDDKRYNSGNYFKTKEAAERVAEQIREIFKNSKAE